MLYPPELRAHKNDGLRLDEDDETCCQFIVSRTYRKAVTPKTLAWYKCSFAAFDGSMNNRQAILPRITRAVAKLETEAIIPQSTILWASWKCPHQVDFIGRGGAI